MKTEILNSILSELQGIRKALEPKPKPCPDYVNEMADDAIEEGKADQKPRYEVCGIHPINLYVVHDHRKDTDVFSGSISECASKAKLLNDYEADQKHKLPESMEDLADWGRCDYHTVRVLEGAQNAFSALSDLYDLRKEYWQAEGWEPDWGNFQQNKYSIRYYDNTPDITIAHGLRRFLVFPTRAQAQHFLKHHRALIEQARELL